MSDYTWDETKEILDDPYVSADTKQAVLYNYAMAGDGNEAAEAYYEKYNVAPHPYPGPYMGSRGNYEGYDGRKDPYEKAREESEAGSYRGSQLESKLDENADELDQAQPPASSSSSAGGVTTSDELLELAKDALDTFHTFLPIDAQVPADSKHIDGPLDYATDIRERYWEQSGIDFRKFLDDAEQLRKAHGTLKELRTSTQQDLNSLYRDWTGDAANASYQQYSEDIEPNAADLIEHLDGASQVIEAAVQTVFDTVKHKAEQVMQLYTPTVGQATPEIAKQVMTLANGDFSTQDEVLEVAAWVDSVCGSNLEATIRADNCGLNDENKELVKTECKTWIRESWNVDLYDNLYASFTSLCDSTKEAVDQAYSTLNEYLGEYENGFPAQQGGTPGGTQPPGVDTGVGTPGTGTPGTGTPGAGTPGAGTPGAGAGTPSVATPGAGSPGGGAPAGGGPGGGSPGAPTTPSTPAPDVPKPDVPKPEAPKVPEFETPGPGTGGPGTGGGDTDGDGEPDLPEFETPDLKKPDLGLDDDGDGKPDNVLDTPGDDRDRLTVEEGDNTLEITEPDDDGKMEISVDDGTGLPKDYRLDFGNDDAAGDDAAGNGAAGGGNASGDTGDRREVRAEDAAEAYDGGSDGGTDGGKVHTPGPDGTIRIEDGDLTIVAEQPEGPDGPTLVTVDDGTGEPTTYTLDGVDSGDSGDSGADSGLRTLPKEFEPPSSGSLDLDDGPAGGDDPAGGGGAAVGGGVTGGSGSVGEGAGSIGAGAGSVGGGGGGGFSADAEAPQPLNEGSRTSATTGALPTSGAPAAVAGGGDAGGGAAGGRGGMMGGGMMGAPMGAGGGAGGQGGDQERTSSYRIDGGLFDGSESPQAITGTIGDDPPAVRYDK